MSRRLKPRRSNAALISADAANDMSTTEALDLIFAPGLSTAEQVTQDAGRGVGMDAVREGIREVRGEVEVENNCR